MEECVIDGVAGVRPIDAPILDERGFLMENIEESVVAVYIKDVAAHMARFGLLEYTSAAPAGWLVVSGGAAGWSAAFQAGPAGAGCEVSGATLHEAIDRLLKEI